MNELKTDPFGVGADVYFAPSNAEVDDYDPDDEEIETPADVVALLGFDPADGGDENTGRKQYATTGAEEFAKDGSGEWITIGGDHDPNTGERHVGGTPVKIGEGGRIVAGPEKLEGKTIGQLKESKSEPRNGIQNNPVKLSITRWPNHTKEYIARIDGVDDKYDLNRVFESPSSRNWSRSGKHGTTDFEIDTPGIYEIQEPSTGVYDGKSARRWVEITDSGDVIPKTKDEVYSTFGADKPRYKLGSWRHPSTGATRVYINYPGADRGSPKVWLEKNGEGYRVRTTHVNLSEWGENAIDKPWETHASSALNQIGFSDLGGLSWQDIITKAGPPKYARYGWPEMYELQEQSEQY